MTTDRELMDLAAKAAGIKLRGWSDYHQAFHVDASDRSDAVWNPRDDDGDSRRLEVALRLRVDVADEHVRVMYGLHTADRMVEHTEPFGRDPHAATRLAVLRVAAEIGKAMP